MASFKLVFGIALVFVCVALWSAEVHGATLINDGDMAKLQELLNSAAVQFNKTFEQIVDGAPKMAEDIKNRLKSLAGPKAGE